MRIEPLRANIDAADQNRTSEKLPWRLPKITPSQCTICTPQSWFLLAAALILTACTTPPRQETPPPVATAPTPAPTPSTPPAQFPRSGGYYLDDGPGDKPPANLDAVADAVPRAEPLHRNAMRPYTVMGREYTPMTAHAPYRARGVASWYGRRYHGKLTSIGEPYDMYAMSAAHPTLPLPSYVRVTNVASGKSVVVRVNDRGPFIDSRLIDLSYTAAYKLGTLKGGSGLVDVELIVPGAAQPVVAAGPTPTPTPTPASGPVPAATPVATPPVPAASPVAKPALPASSAPAVSTVATTASTAPQIPVATEAGRVYLQLAAFGSKDNADAYASRVRADVTWLDGQLRVEPREGLFRVRAGPYPSREEARQAADRINQTLRVTPFVQTK